MKNNAKLCIKFHIYYEIFIENTLKSKCAVTGGNNFLKPLIEALKITSEGEQQLSTSASRYWPSMEERRLHKKWNNNWINWNSLKKYLIIKMKEKEKTKLTLLRIFDLKDWDKFALVHAVSKSYFLGQIQILIVWLLNYLRCSITAVPRRQRWRSSTRRLTETLKCNFIANFLTLPYSYLIWY